MIDGFKFMFLIPVNLKSVAGKDHIHFHLLSLISIVVDEVLFVVYIIEDGVLFLSNLIIFPDVLPDTALDVFKNIDSYFEGRELFSASKKRNIYFRLAIASNICLAVDKRDKKYFF